MASTYVQVLLKYEEDLVSSLIGTDLVKLSRDLLKRRVLSKNASEKFASLDLDHLEDEIKVRYLLQLVCERVREEETACSRLINVFSKLEVKVKEVCESMKKEIEGTASSSGAAQNGDVFITARDIRDIVELIVDGSHMWEEIGVALGVPEYVRVECRSAGSNPLKLSKLLSAWISGKYEDAKTTTLHSLKTALAGGIVKLPDVAKKLDLFSSSLETSAPFKHPNLGCLVIECQSCDTEVAEGKSTLLEVQVNCSGCECYQWSKDSQTLLDGADFSGVCSNILYINRASQCVEGKYCCCVSRGSENKCSDEMNLSVIYPPEKRELLKLYSITEREMPKDSWPPVGNKTFVNLVLIEQKPVTTFNYHTIRGDMDDILQSKETAEYDEVFREYREGALVLIEGRPGSGKTTLVHKLTRDWARENKVLQGAKMVFLVTLRLLNANRRDTTLLDLLQIFYGDILIKNIEHDLINSRGKGACFILDGLDEYPVEEKKKLIIDELLYNKMYLPLSMIVVASRPVATRDLRKICSPRVEVVGFSKGQIYQYVRGYPFDKSSMASEMETYLMQHPNVLHMCYLPVHAAMICFLFNELEGNIPHRETQIYEQFTIATLLRHKSRKKKGEHLQVRSLADVNDEEKESLFSVSKLAYEMIMYSQQVLRKSDTQICLLFDLGFGCLTVERTSGCYGNEELYTFHHLTFQEFLAAFYIREAQLENVELIKHKNLKNVWKFYCGLVQSNRQIEFAKLICEPKSYYEGDVLYRVQCAFESQHTEVCDSVESGTCMKLSRVIISSTDFIALGYVMSKLTKPITNIVLVNCDWHKDGVDLFALMATSSKLQFIKHLKVRINHFEALNALLYHLRFLEHLDLSSTGLNKTNIECLTSGITLSHLKVLKITLPLMPPCSHPEEVLNLLTFGCDDMSLQVFYSVHDTISNDSHALYYDSHTINHAVWRKILSYAFRCQVIQDSSMSWLHLYNSVTIPSLSHERLSYCTEVVLINCCIGDEGAEILANTLKTTVLENLVLDFNRINDSGAIALAGCLERCSVVQEVSIQCNSIGDSGAIKLADALVHCNNLRRLDLQGNSLGDRGAVAIAKATQSMPSLDLYLHNVNITEEGIDRVLEHRARTTIRRMEFTSSWDNVSESDLDTLKNALYCGHLPALKLSFKNIENIKKLVAVKEYVRNVRGLKGIISDNNLLTVCAIIRSLSSLNHIQYGFGAVSNSFEQFIDSLKTCKSLQSLSLSGNQQLPMSFEVMKCFTNLCSLHLSGSDMDLHELGLLCSNHRLLCQLHTLSMYFIKILHSDGQVLGKALVHCKSLRCLNLINNELGDGGAIAVAEGLKDHTNLLQLRLGLNGITSDGMAALSRVIRCNHQLQHLDLSDCQLYSEGIPALLDVMSGGNLQTLDLSQNKLCGEDIARLSIGLKKCTQLLELDVSSNDFVSSSIAYLAEGLQYNLQILKLYDNNITSEGIPGLLDIMKKCKYLQRIDLGDNKIDANDAAVLVAGWQHNNLLKLNLRGSSSLHESSLFDGRKCCDSCDHLQQLCYNNDYVLIILAVNFLPKLVSPQVI